MCLRAARTAMLSPASLLWLSSLLWPGLAGAHPASPAPPHVVRDVGSCKLKAKPNVRASAGFGFNTTDCAIGTGKQVGWWIFVDFPDAPDDNRRPAPDTVPWANQSQWFTNSSYGLLDVGITGTGDFYRMPAPSTSYGFDGVLTTEKHEKYISDAVAVYMQGRSDLSRPSYADIIYIVPTKKARAIGRTYVYNDPVVIGGKRYAGRAVTIGQGGSDTNTFVWGAALSMCLPDYRAVDGGRMNRFVGGWSITGEANSPAPDLFAWDKWRLGWIPDADIDCITTKGTSEHVLAPLLSSEGHRAVVVAHNDTEVLVAEFRTGIVDGVDRNICSPGTLLYVVDTTKPSGEGPIRVLDASPSTNGCQDEPLNDATLNMAADRNAPSFDLRGNWNIVVTVLEQTIHATKIRVDWYPDGSRPGQ